MAIILQYLLVILCGYLAGVAVNFVSDWYYVRRQFLGEYTVDELRKAGWVKYLTWPFSVRTIPQAHKVRVLLVELVYVLLALGMWFNRPDRVQLWWGIPVLIYFGVVIVMDVEFRVVLHPISIAGAVLGVLVGVYLRGFWPTLLGGVVGFSVMFLLYKFGEIFMNWVNRKRDEMIDEVALGYGDVNMAGVVGLFLGWPPIILGLLFAIFSAGVVSILFILISLVIRRFRAFAAMPYAPFLAFAALVMLFFPEQIASLLGG